MIYPHHFKDKIAFTQVEELLMDACLSSLGRERVSQMNYLTDFELLFAQLSETDEFRRLLEAEGQFPSQDYYDLRDTLQTLKVEGTFIDLEKLQYLQASLQTLAQILVYIDALDEALYPHILALIEEVSLPVEVMKALFHLLDAQGQIADSATPELLEIRRAMRSKQLETDKRIRKYMQQAKSDGWISEDAEPSIRNERLVIPMLAGNKRKMKGFVHDVSATGQTVFIEPEEVFVLNNEIRELENDERLEIIKILREFSQLLRPYCSELQEAYDFLGHIDFLRAKAQLALRMGGVMPMMSDEPTLEWWDARHPLLELSLKKQGKKIVPLSLRLDSDERILIISGPNAGGKSVCLKTVGLLQYMLQCGLLIPLSESSEAGIFEHLFIDIGDQQSIENDLSTYSSHLTNMKHLVTFANERTLFLADELGSGTEPQMGGAIAEAIIEHVHERKAFGVITTHYANLKLMADKLEGVVNGAMLFDTDFHKPLYQLKMGTPGSSFAMEMAKNIGLQDHILDTAAEKMGDSHLRFEQQLQQLEVEKKILEQEKIEVALSDQLLSETLDKYHKLSATLEQQKKEILSKAKQEALNIVRDANAKVEKTIRDIKTVQAEKEATRKIREELEKAVEKPIKIHLKKNVVSQEGSALKVGSRVRLYEGGAIAEIAEIQGKKALVVSGLVKMTLPMEQLIAVDGRGADKAQRSADVRMKTAYANILSDINERKLHFSAQLDLRGQTADDALESTRKFLDDALLFGEKHLRILHGRGDGILRRIVRQELQQSKEVERFEFEHIDRGGDGITLVYLR